MFGGYNLLYIGSGLLYLSFLDLPDESTEDEEHLMDDQWATVHHYMGLTSVTGLLLNLVTHFEGAVSADGWWLLSGQVEVILMFGVCCVFSLWLYWSGVCRNLGRGYS